jgi:hydrogenase nickel incorporation protein HypA/HybF
MHELSLALEVVDIAQREAGKQGVTAVSEILIEVGDLSGVEADAFQSALELVVKDSVLEKALVNLQRTPGTGKCRSCNVGFQMKTRVDTCPNCRCFPSEITGGDEFRIVSLTID